MNASDVQTSLLALNQNWLDTNTLTGCGGNGLTTDTLLVNGTYHYYYPWTYPVYVSSPERPIKLTLKEIDKLRKAAKDDAALRDVLAKFTPQIEVIVEF